MNDRTKTKLSRIAKVIDVIAKINMALLIFSLVLVLVNLLFPGTREAFYDNFATTLDFGELSFRFPTHDQYAFEQEGEMQEFTDGNSGNYLLPDKKVLDIKFYYEIFASLFTIIATISGIWIVHRMMQPLINKQPFSYELSDYFKRLALIIVIASVVLSFSHNLFYLYFYHAYELPDILSVYHETHYDGGHISRALLLPNFEGGSLGTSLVAALFLWIASILLEHGAGLQAQSDTTL